MQRRAEEGAPYEGAGIIAIKEDTSARMGSDGSCVVNELYFASQGMNYQHEVHLLWEDEAVDMEYATMEVDPFLRTRSKASLAAAANLPLVPFSPPHESLLQSHSLYRLTSFLPLLHSLTLSSTSALHLPSLSFLSSLPHLHSFRISHAYFLPVESLYDLRYVASTLTHLHISDSFPVDSDGRIVYLLHDVIQPLQLSQQVTQVFTFDFPQSVRNTQEINRKSVEAASSIRHTASGSNVGGEFPIIPVRHDSWCEILRHPTPPSGPSKVPSLLNLFREWYEKPRATEQTLMKHPDLEKVKEEWQRMKDAEDRERYPYHLVFDSKTILAAPPSSIDYSSLTSRLLPNLQFCEIRHHEPHCWTIFVYDRMQVPRHQFGDPEERNSKPEEWQIESAAEHKNILRTAFGVELNPIETDIPGTDCECFFMKYEDRIKRNSEKIYTM